MGRSRLRASASARSESRLRPRFKGKTVIETHHHTVPHHRLELVPELSVLEKGRKAGLDGNLIIEGDNLLALKALLPTHAGRVKCIYIDAPYNTDNEGWDYNDNLSGSSD
jgi:adenine-specific DNA-methyltransferase